jgi:dienelactone hydrolase
VSAFRLAWAVVFLACISVQACSPVHDSAPSPEAISGAPAASPDSRDQLLSIPVRGLRGDVVQLTARICRPAGDLPAALVIINHGSPVRPADRAKMQLGRCDQEAARWFLRRGYVVAFALRRGYGKTGGEWAEGYGECSDPNFERGGLSTARDIDAIVNYATALPFVRPDGVVVVGQSAGGWGTIAYDSRSHPKVAAFINFAGGRGGHRDNMPNRNCREDVLIEAAGRYGSTATTPMLWLYTANDSFFAPPLASAMWRAFTAAGGKGDFEQPGPSGNDGHGFFSQPGSSLTWGPLVERYLAQRGAAAN